VGYINAYITVLRSFGSLGAVSASFSTLDGTAVAGVKYIPTNGVVAFGDGETTPRPSPFKSATPPRVRD